jgi:hypothetical protein
MGERVRILSDILTEIEFLARLRRSISERLLTELDEDALAVRNNLLELEHWPVGSAPHIDQRRQNLEQRHATLVRERRAEVVKEWADLARLAQERRSWLKQHADQVQRMQLLEGRKEPVGSGSAGRAGKSALLGLPFPSRPPGEGEKPGDKERA